MPVCEDDTTRSFFRVSVSISVGNGASMLFWSEHWLNRLDIEELTPGLMASVPARQRNRRTV
jgi:hypothetical protein